MCLRSNLNTHIYKIHWRRRSADLYNRLSTSSGIQKNTCPGHILKRIINLEKYGKFYVLVIWFFFYKNRWPTHNFYFTNFHVCINFYRRASWLISIWSLVYVHNMTSKSVNCYVQYRCRTARHWVMAEHFAVRVRWCRIKRFFV